MDAKAISPKQKPHSPNLRQSSHASRHFSRRSKWRQQHKDHKPPLMLTRDFSTMPSKERFPVEQSPAYCPNTSVFIYKTACAFSAILIVTVGFTLPIGTSPQPRFLFGSIHWKHSICLENSTPLLFKKQIFTRSTLLLSIATVKHPGRHVPRTFRTACHFLLPPESRLADFVHFDLASLSANRFQFPHNRRRDRFSFHCHRKGKRIELSCLFSSDSPTPFRGDPGDIRLILINLIDYAMSYHTR